MLSGCNHVPTVKPATKERVPGGCPHPHALSVRRATFLVFPQYRKEFAHGVPTRILYLRERVTYAIIYDCTYYDVVDDVLMMMMLFDDVIK